MNQVKTMQKLFGTDGLRGVAGEYPLDPATLELLGRVLFFLLYDQGFPLQLIAGRDTRESGSHILEALIRGFSGAGGEVDDAGVLPTPALAYLAHREGTCAVSITASHNPFRDNGIKMFGPDGYKLSEELERVIEPILLGETALERTSPRTAGRPKFLIEDFHSKYLNHLCDEVFSGLDLSGMNIAVDCANGALSEIAPQALRRLGATVLAIHSEPDGKNINQQCGSLHPEVLQETIRENDVTCGFTFDGDGDRCMVVDSHGIYDGDYILGTSARYLQSAGMLKNNAVVATWMSNLGLETFLRNLKIKLFRVPVGDKYVLEKLQQEDLSLGGEQSGHIIFRNDSFIGDGLLTALQVLRMHRNTGGAFTDLWDGFRKFPQILRNVPVRRKPELESIPEVRDKLNYLEEQLGESGRVLLRYSGTEMLARIMIEGPDASQIERLAGEMAEVLRDRLN